jgi:lipoyl(octanoyl) transferase
VRCFAKWSQWDVLRGGVKVSGAGQRRCREGLLHQGSLRVAEDLGEAFWLEFARELASEVEVLGELPGAVKDRAEVLAVSRYGSELWLKERR